MFERGFRFNYDAMHAVTGVYARRLFGDELGCPTESIQNSIPLEDFGGGHPGDDCTEMWCFVVLLLFQSLGGDGPCRPELDVRARPGGGDEG